MKCSLYNMRHEEELVIKHIREMHYKGYQKYYTLWKAELIKALITLVGRLFYACRLRKKVLHGIRNGSLGFTETPHKQ